MRHPRRGMLIAGLVAVAVLLPLGAVAHGDAARSEARHGSDPRRVGYFIQWGIYGRAFFVKNLDTSGAAARLTHVNYAFGNVAPDAAGDVTCASGDVWADYQRPVGAEESVDGVGDVWGEPLNGNLGQLLKLKARHPNLRVMMSLGGWTWSKYFSDAALTAASRAAFVASCVDMFIKGNLPSLGPGESGGPGSAAGVFDGIDLDWEWPASEGNAGNVIRPEDRGNFTLLLAEFRRQLDEYGRQAGRRYELTAFLPAAPAKIEAGFEPGLPRHLGDRHQPPVGHPGARRRADLTRLQHRPGRTGLDRQRRAPRQAGHRDPVLRPGLDRSLRRWRRSVPAVDRTGDRHLGSRQ
jgi:chitinase